MLIRLVTMKFKEEHIPEFEALFEMRKERIRSVDGCEYLELLQDRNDPSVFTTYSIWNSETALNEYRSSAFFKETWQHTKSLFKEKPNARSYFLKATLD